MEDEYNSLRANKPGLSKTYNLVFNPLVVNGSSKTNVDCTFQQHKMRVVAKDFHW